MKKRSPFLPIFGSYLVVVLSSAHAADVVKAANTNALNLGTSWTSGTAPTSSDVAVWDSTITAGNSSALSADVSWAGIKVTNPGGTQNNASNTNSILITGSGSQITLGTSGIDLSTATQAIQTQSKILIAGDQTWNVKDANTNGSPFGGAFGEDLYFNAQTAGTALNFGGKTVSTSGAGAIAISSGYTLSNGTLGVNNSGGLLIQSGGSRTTTLNSNLTLNIASGRTLKIQTNSGSGGLAVNSAAAVNINGGTLNLASSGATGTTRYDQTGKISFSGTSTVSNTIGFGYFANFTGEVALSGTTTWTESGSSTANTTISGPITGSGTLNYRATTTTHRTDLSGNNSGFTGTINIDGTSGSRNLRLINANAGSASATWAVSANNTLQVDGVAVNLGTLNGAGSVTNSHASTAASITVGSGTFSGVISNGTPANGLALTKTGSGTLALTGANTYSGLTSVAAGTLTTTTAQTGAGAVTVADTGTFGVTQVGNGATFNTSALTLGSTGGATLVLTPAASPSVPLVTASTLEVNGPTTLRLTSVPADGTTLIGYSGIGGSSGFSGLNLVLPFRISGSLVNTGSGIVLTSIANDTPKWGSGDGVWDINTSANWKTSATSTSTNYLQGGAGATDSVIFDDSASGTSPITVTLNTTVSPVGITVAGTKDYTISGSGTIAGTAGISKTGSSALTLATANTFSGGVQLTEGTLNVNNASALGSGTLTIASGTVLNNTSGAAVTASPAVAQVWNGSFTFTGSNDLNLGGAVTASVSPTVTVSSGTLAVGGISGTGINLTKEGSGALAIGAGSYNGTTAVNVGTLRAGAVAAFNTTSSITLTDAAGVNLDLNGFNQTVNTLTGGGTTGGNVLLGGGTLTTSSSGTIGALSGAGGLVKNGSSTFTIVGDTTVYTGSTTINGGVLNVGNAGNFLASSGVLTMANGAVLQGFGSISRTLGNGNTVVSGNGGFAARGGQLDVNLGAFFNLAAGSNALGGNFILGSATANNVVRILSSFGINNYGATYPGSTRTITVIAGEGGDSAELAGAITPGGAGGISGINKNGGGLLTLSAANTYIGSTNVNEGSLNLAATGQLTFMPTTNGSSNKIYDASPNTLALNSVSLNGAFVIDLASAAVATGNSWTLVDLASVNATFGATFSVVGFDDSDLDNVWKKVDASGNTWSFSEATGALTVVRAGYISWITGTFANGTVAVDQQGANADPDGDGVSNLVEYAIAGLDPTVANGAPGTFAGNVLSYSKRQPLDASLSYKIEQSVDLGTTPWAEVPAGAAYINNDTTISYELPTSLPANFIRLNVTKP